MKRLLVVLIALGGCSAPPGGEDSRFRFVSVPIEVRGLSPAAGFVPVSCPLDLGGILKQAGVPGAVDERSIRLFRAGSGAEEEIPVQFLASPRRLGKRRLLPGTHPKVSYAAEHAAGETPASAPGSGTLSWIVRDGTRRYRLELGIPRRGRLVQVPYPPNNLRGFDAGGKATPLPHFPHMQIRPQWPLEGKLHVLEDNVLVTTYHVGPSPGESDPRGVGSRRPFFYPVIGPDGVGLTEFGKPHDPTGSHAHHYSLWIAHARVGGKNFWSERGGVIANERLELLEDGPIFCRIVQRTRWSVEGKDVLRGRRTFTIYRSERDFRLIDVTLEFTPSGTSPVELGQTTFGFLAARVAQSINPFDGGGEILTSEGKRNEQEAHLSHGSWLDQSGPVLPGRRGGIAILDHPGNPGHPTGWHCRNDGWAGASFNKNAPWTLEPGTPLRLRYRIVLHRHDAVTAGIARRFADYAERPSIRLGKPVR